jgi:hypothetical protein
MKVLDSICGDGRMGDSHMYLEKHAACFLLYMVKESHWYVAFYCHCKNLLNTKSTVEGRRAKKNEISKFLF